MATNDCNGGVAAQPLGSSFLSGATSGAFDACDQLVLDGYADYRVPDVTDLRGIRFCSTGASTSGVDDQDICLSGSTVPTIDGRIFPVDSTSIFWSRQTSYWSSNWAQFLALDSGGTAATGKTGAYSVLCVRP